MRRRSNIVRFVALAIVVIALAVWWSTREPSEVSPAVVANGTTVVGRDADVVSERSLDVFSPDEAPRSSARRAFVDANGPELVVRTIDEDGNALADVALALVDDAEELDVGHTGAAGSCTLHLVDAEGVAIVATHDGYARALRDVPEVLPARVTIRMHRVGSISGRVRWQDTGDVVPNAKVYAFLDGYEPSVARIRATLDHRPMRDVAISQADGEGRYSIDGLARDRGYTVRALAPGAVTAKRFEGVRPGRDGMDVTLAAVQVARLHVRERGGGAIRTSVDVVSSGIQFPDLPLVFEVLSTPPEFALLDPVLSALSTSPYVRDPLVFARTKRHDTPRGAHDCEVQVPGYAKAVAPVTFAPIDEPVPETTIELEPTATRWGRLRVACSRTLVGSEIARTGSLGVLLMTPSEGSNEPELSIPLRKPWEGERVIDGIPFGTYTGSFSIDGWVPRSMKSEHAIEFTIGETEARVDLGPIGTGVVRVSLVDRDGVPYTGDVTFRTAAGGSDAYFTFRRGPYWIDGLEASEYRLSLARMPGVAVAHVRAVSFVVAPDAITDVVVAYE